MRTETLVTPTASIPAAQEVVDLDSTDELPALDVDAYEARVADRQKGLSRTDTWCVEALHDMEELAESATQARSPGRATASGSEALTVNVERILKRIAEVEADIVAAQDSNVALKTRSEEIQADRDRQIEQLRALEAEAARLREQRALADEMAQRVEQQLRQQLQRATTEITELQAARAAERLQANEQREQLERQIAAMAERGESLQESHRAVQGQLRAASDLARQRAASVTELEGSLLEEKTSNAQLARQLAAKLKDVEVLSALIEARHRTIEELARDRDDLAARLEQAVTSGTELSVQLGAARDGLHADRALMAERDSALAEKDRQIGELTADLDRAGMDLAGARQQQDATTDALSELAATHGKSLRELAQFGAEIDGLRGSLQAAEQREAQVQQELSTALLAAKEARQSRGEMEKRLGEVQENLATLMEERDAAHAQARSLRERLDALLPASKQLDVLTAQLEEFRETIEARDQVVENLGAQLQTVRDERAALSAQLEKSRTRVKSMSQQIFSRDSQIAALQADLAVYTEALAAIRRDVSRIGEPTGREPGEDLERVLEPLEHEGAPIVLNGEMLTIGRTSENDIVIPSRLISRHHARLLVGPTGVILEDAGSTNGCFVNGEQVRQHLMREGDVLELGEIRYRLSVRAANLTRPRTNVVSITESHHAEE